MNNATTTTCPKCEGTGHIRAFDHIANGDCFECGTSGRVSVHATTTDTGPPVASKTIQTDIGDLHIFRFGKGFQAWHDRGCVWFEITNGRVCEVVLSCGMELDRHTRASVRSILQSACTA